MPHNSVISDADSKAAYYINMVEYKQTNSLIKWSGLQPLSFTPMGDKWMQLVSFHH